jgi:hypothetical protein
VDHRSATEREATLDEQVRDLGFDPAQLTRSERLELLEQHRLCPDEALTV